MVPRTVLLLALASLAVLAPGRPAGALQRDPAEVQPQPLRAVFDCYRHAHDDTLLEGASIEALCRGAADAGPAVCYGASRARTFLSDGDAIALCRCAASTAPVECYREGYRTTTLEPSRILALCSPTERLGLDPDCAPIR
jgi:hypothetical protein